LKQQARDAFDNVCVNNFPSESSNALFFALLGNATLPIDNTALLQVQNSMYDGGSAYYQGGVQYIENGVYTVQYTAFASNNYNLRGQVQQSGGLYGTYFENTDFVDNDVAPDGSRESRKSFERIDPEINFVWRINERPCGNPTDIQKEIGPDYFSVRWRGMLKPTYSEVITFQVEVDRSAKLYVNGLLVLDRKQSLNSVIYGTIALMKDVLYPIQLDYYKVTGNGTVRLSWFSASQPVQIVPKERLFSNSTSYFLSNSNQPLFVEPGVVCASTSECGGPQLTVATAGSKARFTLQVYLL
jgi:hypothetical protein